MRRGLTPLDRAVRTVIMRQASFYGVTPVVEAKAILNGCKILPEPFMAAVRVEYAVEQRDHFRRHGWA